MKIKNKANFDCICTWIPIKYTYIYSYANAVVSFLGCSLLSTDRTDKKVSSMILQHYFVGLKLFFYSKYLKRAVNLILVTAKTSKPVYIIIIKTFCFVLIIKASSAVVEEWNHFIRNVGYLPPHENIVNLLGFCRKMGEKFSILIAVYVIKHVQLRIVKLLPIFLSQL